jgi:predicted dehydrogenase
LLQLAIVGLGSWGRRLVESVQDRSGTVRFSVAVTGKSGRSDAFAREHGLGVTTDLASVLADPAVGGVVSCGPAHLHAAHSLAALEAGKPVLAVKPMALTLADAQRLREASRRRGALLALGYNRCFFPNVVELRRRLATGAFGRVLHSEGDFCVDRYRDGADDWKADPSVVLAGSLADHMLYLTIETMGPIAEAYALAQRDVTANGLADVTAVALRTQGGRTALLTAIGVTPDYYRFQVFGTKAWAEVLGSRHFTFQPLEGEREEIRFPAIDAERAEVEAFAAAVAGDSVFPVSVEDATHSVAVLEAMGRSAVDGAPRRVG